MSDDDISDAIDRIYTYVDAMLRAGLFEDVDVLLVKANPSAMEIEEMLAWVSITSTAADRLPARAEFMKRVRTRIGDLKSPDVAAYLLRGFA